MHSFYVSISLHIISVIQQYVCGGVIHEIIRVYLNVCLHYKDKDRFIRLYLLHSYNMYEKIASVYPLGYVRDWSKYTTRGAEFLTHEVAQKLIPRP